MIILSSSSTCKQIKNKEGWPYSICYIICETSTLSSDDIQIYIACIEDADGIPRLTLVSQWVDESVSEGMVDL